MTIEDSTIPSQIDLSKEVDNQTIIYNIPTGGIDQKLIALYPSLALKHARKRPAIEYSSNTTLSGSIVFADTITIDSGVTLTSFQAAGSYMVLIADTITVDGNIRGNGWDCEGANSTAGINGSNGASHYIPAGGGGGAYNGYTGGAGGNGETADGGAGGTDYSGGGSAPTSWGFNSSSRYYSALGLKYDLKFLTRYSGSVGGTGAIGDDGGNAGSSAHNGCFVALIGNNIEINGNVYSYAENSGAGDDETNYGNGGGGGSSGGMVFIAAYKSLSGSGLIDVHGGNGGTGGAGGTHGGGGGAGGNGGYILVLGDPDTIPFTTNVSGGTGGAGGSPDGGDGANGLDGLVQYIQI